VPLGMNIKIIEIKNPIKTQNVMNTYALKYPFLPLK